MIFIYVGPLSFALMFHSKAELHQSGPSVTPCCAAFRYRGRGLLGQVVAACGLQGGALGAAGLAALLLYLAEDPLARHGDTWRLLLLTAACHALFRSLGVLVSSRSLGAQATDSCQRYCFVSISNFLTSSLLRGTNGPFELFISRRSLTSTVVLRPFLTVKLETSSLSSGAGASRCGRIWV